MKTLLLTLAIATACCTLSAQERLSDRWKETQRLDLKNKPVAYTDTLRLLNVTKEGLNIRKGSFMYKGIISNDLLEVGDLSYGIMKNEQNEIQLRDEENIHIFTREAKDMSAADAVAGKAKIDLPATWVSSIDKSILKGTWEAYKRESRKGPLAKVDYKVLIKTLTFSEQKTGDYYGSVTADFINGAALYFIKDVKAPDLLVDDKDKTQHSIKVWKLTAEELIVEDEAGIVYYMKHFR